jgi:hypothetical protein
MYVEMEEADLAEISGFKPAMGLPEGAEPTGAGVDKAIDTLQVLKHTLDSAISIVYEGIKTHQPDEWTLELNIGFKGKAQPIPVILSGESEVAMKVIAKWKKPEEKKNK